MIGPRLWYFATTVLTWPSHGVLNHCPGSAIERALRISMSGLCQLSPPGHGRMYRSGRPFVPYSIWMTASFPFAEITLIRKSATAMLDVSFSL